jgi:oxalate decarboxylase
MEHNGNKDQLSRRGFLGIGSAALVVAAGSVAVSGATAQESQPRTGRSATDPGPTDATLDGQNVDSAWPPGTDSKSLVPTFKCPFSLANKRTYDGGWSREVTVRELPVSKSMAGVNMRLSAGGVRELHWHTADEWAIMLYGTARITAIDRDGKSFVADVKQTTCGTSPAGSRIPFKAWSRMARNSCWSSTMAIFRKPKRFC